MREALIMKIIKLLSKHHQVICLQVIACASARLACVPALSTYHQRQDCTEELLYELDVRAYVR